MYKYTEQGSRFHCSGIVLQTNQAALY